MSGPSNPVERAAPTKAFPTADVLSTITGRLMGDIGGIYTVLGWMTGESVYTHQIPRIRKEACAAMLALRPDLVRAVNEADQVNRDNWRGWLATWTARYGDTIDVVKLNADQHERIDPHSELAEKLPPERIVLADLGR